MSVETCRLLLKTTSRTNAAAARRAKAQELLDQSPVAYLLAKQGEKSGPTPGQVTGRTQIERLIADAQQGGPAKMRKELEAQAMATPQFVARRKMSPANMPLNDAIHAYGWEDPRTVAAAVREAAPGKEPPRQNPDLKAGLARLKLQVEREVSLKYIDLQNRLDMAVRATSRQADGAVKTKHPQVARIQAQAASAVKARENLRALIAQEVGSHPKVKGYEEMMRNIDATIHN